jgi:hypothetical protein
MLIYHLAQAVFPGGSPEIEAFNRFYLRQFYSHPTGRDTDMPDNEMDLPQDNGDSQLVDGAEEVYRQFDKPPDPDNAGASEEMWKKAEAWYLQNQPPPTEPPFWTKHFDAGQALMQLNMAYPYKRGDAFGKEQVEYMRNSILKACAEAKSNVLSDAWPHLEPRARLVLIRAHYQQFET